jgi:membrane dipeptidase
MRSAFSVPRLARRSRYGWLLGLVGLVACAGRDGAVREPIGESTAKQRSTTPSSAPMGSPSSADGGAASPGTETLEQRAARVHRYAIVVDTHNDIPSGMFHTGKDLNEGGPDVHTDLVKMKNGGLTASFFSIFVEGDLAEKPTVTGGGSLRRAIDLVDLTYRQVERFPNELVFATTASEIRKAKRDGKVAILMGIEGGHAIENSLSALRVLHRLGCRYMTLTHTNTNEWADSAGFSGAFPVRHHGLTPFGEEVVREMQRLGMLVDISHVSDETFSAVLRIAQAPVIASHSSSRAVADHRRNLNDDMLRALAKNGGVAMVNFWPMFISNDYGTAAKAWQDRNAKTVTELRAKYKGNPAVLRDAMNKLRASDPLPKVPLSVLIDHIDHMVKVAGVDHVGLGSDFDGVDTLPEEIEGVQSLPKITLELMKRGYKDEDVVKILGENFLRVFEKTEAFAKSKGARISGEGSTKRIDR